jgi:transposase-like protein
MEKNLKLVCPKCGTPHQPHSPHTMDADGFERCEIRTIMEDKGWCYECSFWQNMYDKHKDDPGWIRIDGESWVLKPMVENVPSGWNSLGCGGRKMYINIEGKGIVVEMKRGVSSLQLSKIVGVTQKTAWFMLQRIHNCFSIEIKEPCLKGEIEVDETYIGGKNKNRHSKDKVKDAQGRSLKDKTPVFGTLQREGFVVAYVVTDTKGKTLLPLIYNTVHPNSTIYSDEWYAYNGIDKEKFDHQKVYHKKGAYVIGRRSTNTIEGYWSHLKKMISGTHFWVSRKHLQRYVDCESFRYNTKHLSESERFDVFLQNTKRRLRYSQLKKITA